MSATEGAARTYTLLGPDRRPYPSRSPGTLGGHRRGRRYGRLDCPAALRAIARGGYVTQRVFFADEPAAIAAGYRPCAVCLPETYARWARRKAAPHPDVSPSPCSLPRRGGEGPSTTPRSC